jgi:hypothetical protein
MSARSADALAEQGFEALEALEARVLRGVFGVGTLKLPAKRS